MLYLAFTCKSRESLVNPKDRIPLFFISILYAISSITQPFTRRPDYRYIIFSNFTTHVLVEYHIAHYSQPCTRACCQRRCIISRYIFIAVYVLWSLESTGECMGVLHGSIALQKTIYIEAVYYYRFRLVIQMSGCIYYVLRHMRSSFPARQYVRRDQHDPVCWFLSVNRAQNVHLL